MLTTPVFTRLLTTAEFGQYSVFNSWYGIVTIFVSLFLSGGVHQQGLIKFDKERAVFSSSLQGLTTVLVVCWSVVYFLFREFWNNIFSLTTVQMLAMLVMIQATAAFHFWTNEQRVEYKYKALVAITLVVSIANPIVGIFFVTIAEDKVTARILGIVLVELVSFTGLYFIQMKNGKKFFSAKFWKYAILFNLPLVPHYLSQTVLNSADRIMIQHMVGDSEAGIYSLAYSVSAIMILFNTALSQTLGPWLYQKIKEHGEKDMAPVGYITLIIIAVVNLLLIVVAPEVVSFFAPSAYYDAIWVIPPVAIGTLFLYSYDLFAKFAFYYEKTFFIMLISVIGAAFNIFLNCIFIDAYGYIAAGYTTLLCYMIYSIGHYMYMRYLCKVYNKGVYPYDTQKLIVIAIVFMACGFALMLTYKFPLLRYSVLSIALVFMLAFRERLVSIVRLIIALRKEK